MRQKNRYETEVTIHGRADFGQVVEQLKALRNTVIAPARELNGIDREIDKIADLQSRIQNTFDKGVVDRKEFEWLERSIERITDDASRLATRMQNVGDRELQTELKELQEQIKRANIQLNETVRTQKNLIANQLSQVQNGKAYATQLTEAAKKGQDIKKVEQQITQELKKQVEEKRQAKIQTSQNLTAAQSELEAAKKVPSNLFNYQSFQGLDGKPLKLNSEQLGIVKQIFVDVAQSSKTASAAVGTFQKKLREALGVKIKPNSYLLQNGRLTDAFATMKTNIDAVRPKLQEIETEFQKAAQAEEKATKNADAFTAAMSRDDVKIGFNSIKTAFDDRTKAKQDYSNLKNRGPNTNFTQAYNNFSQVLGNVNSQFKEVSKSSWDYYEKQKSINDSLNQFQSRLGYLVSFTNIQYQLRNVVVKTFQDVQKLDKAFASIAMVTDKSVSDLWNSYDDYVQIAKDLGQTTEGTIKASALYYQQGLSTAEALDLTKDTMKLATLAGADFELATEQMTAA